MLCLYKLNTDQFRHNLLALCIQISTKRGSNNFIEQTPGTIYYTYTFK